MLTHQQNNKTKTQGGQSDDLVMPEDSPRYDVYTK